jgi:hypothetical protein
MIRWAKKLTLSTGALFMILSALPLRAAEGHYATPNFPETPHLKMTPGSTCENPDSFRYPEKVPYCERSVKSETKWAIIEDYDRQLGYNIRGTGRNNFKIDHLIPLCMGGSNEISNLWPQHKTIYELTDPLEPALCGRLAEGRMTQVEAIDFIRRAKQNPDEAPRMLRELVGNGRN